MPLKRIIGSYEGTKKGTLLVIIGGMHGNEEAGVKAIQQVLEMLEAEPHKNPNFTFKGKVLGIRGNIAALEAGQRFIHKDLNRQWTKENVAKIFAATDEKSLDSEQKEIKEILNLLHQEIANYQPHKMVVLDLHTTTAFGGIFTIVTNDPESDRIGRGMYAPVIRGFLEGINGTSLHYFTTDNFNVKTIPVTFESGQHDENLSVVRAVAAIINCLRSIGSVTPDDVEHKHDEILINYSKPLPKVAELLYCHNVSPSDGFEMAPGYTNFQKIEKGETLAKDKSGVIRAKYTGRILMPLYQKQGEDGFFIIKTIE